MSHYKPTSQVYYLVVTESKTVYSPQTVVSTVTLNSLDVKNGVNTSSSNWTDGNTLSNYYPGLATGGTDINKTLPLPGERIPWMTNPTLGDPMDCSPPGSSVRGILHGAMNKTDPSSCGRFSPKPCTGSLLRRSARGLSIDLICLSLFILPVILTLPLISVSGLTDWNMYFHALRLLSGCRELHQ